MKPYPPPQWQTLSATAHKTDLGEGLPEVVILLLSEEAYKKFVKSKRAAMKFLDDLHVLKQKLINLIFADLVPSVKGPGGEWIMIVTHTTRSTAVVVGWQLPPPQPPPPPPPPLSQSDLRKPPSKRKGGMRK
jgi:hypothetical protein